MQQLQLQEEISPTTAVSNYLKSNSNGSVFSITSQQQQQLQQLPQKSDFDKTKDELILELQQMRAITVSNKNARIMLDEMYQFVALLDVNGNLLDVNEPALQGGGMIRASIQGIPFWDCRWWATSQENIDNVREAVHKASKGEFIRYETEIFGKSAGTEKITIDFSLMPLFNDKGEVSLILPEGRNITEKRLGEIEIERKNNELRSLYEKIKELDELKTQFFANVSHELRTPLALIVGPTDKLLKEENLNENVRKDLEIVARNSRGLLKIVNNLLDISRLEAGKMNLNYSMVNLSQTVHLIASCFEILAREKSLDFSIITPSTPLVAAIDADKMQRVITNLLSNAFKFTPSGGSVKCILEKFDISTSVPGFQIIVSDTGPGIPDKLHDIIFERFRQVDGTNTRKHGGTGLGLSIVKEFVTLHGGTVSIHNVPKGGAQFTLRIPLSPNMDEQLYKKTISDSNISEIVEKQDHEREQKEHQEREERIKIDQLQYEQQQQQNGHHDNSNNHNNNNNNNNNNNHNHHNNNNLILPSTSSSSSMSIENQMLNSGLKDNMGSIMGVHAIAQQAVEELSEKQFYQSKENIHNKPIVLVVEDNPEMNRFIAELLSKYYFVVTAFDGIEGIEKTKAFTPDLIVTDCMMPKMSGDEMVEKLRSDEQYDNIPIILLTAKADENLRVRLLQNGVSDYVNKPFSSEELVARVVNLMTMKKAKQFLQEELSSANTDLQELINQLTLKKRDLQALVGELEKERNLLNNTNKSKDEFFMNLSHELRTPLNGILGWCQLLLYDLDSSDDSTIRTGLETIERCASSQNQLINDLLDMSLIIGDKFSLIMGEVDLPLLVENAIASILVSAQSKHISIDTHIEEPSQDPQCLENLRGDKARLQQVIWNLLSNSIKFTNENGRIEINAKVVNQIPINELGFCSNPMFNPIQRQGERWILLTVSDNGKGIPNKFLPNVFDRFKQADCSSTRSYGGLGIGLSITQNIIHLHKGAVFANSQGENKGSQFTVVLPVTKMFRSNSNSPILSDTSSPPIIKKSFFNQPIQIDKNQQNQNYFYQPQQQLQQPQQQQQQYNNSNSNMNNINKRQREDDQSTSFINNNSKFLPSSQTLIPSPLPIINNSSNSNNNNNNYNNSINYNNNSITNFNDNSELELSSNNSNSNNNILSSNINSNLNNNNEIVNNNNEIITNKEIINNNSNNSNNIINSTIAKTLASSMSTASASPSSIVLPALSPYSSEILKSPNLNLLKSPKSNNNKHLLAGISIMLVDDLEDTNYLFSSMLYKLGAKRIDTFQRVSDAYQFLCDSTKPQPDIILSDLTMPFEDGYSMVRKLRDREKINPQNKVIPIIALTASVSSSDKEKVLKSGFDLHCPKPVNFLDLSLSILSLIDKYNVINNEIQQQQSNNQLNNNINNNNNSDNYNITDSRPCKKANISTQDDN